MKTIKQSVKNSLGAFYFATPLKRFAPKACSAWLAFHREMELRALVRQVKSELVPDDTLRFGPFSGLKYPIPDGQCLGWIPKLVGTYEKELQPKIEAIATTPYKTIVNVGSAEGYFAVGLALRCSSARVLAFDVNPVVRSLCEKLVQANQVEDRVQVLGWCDPAELGKLAAAKPALVLSDCEGFELQLLSPEFVRSSPDCDVLVEAHDFINPDVSRVLSRRFAATHEIEFINSVPRSVADFPCPSSLSAHKKLIAMDENRPGRMSWLWMRHRGARGSSACLPESESSKTCLTSNRNGK